MAHFVLALLVFLGFTGNVAAQATAPGAKSCDAIMSKLSFGYVAVIGALAKSSDKTNGGEFVARICDAGCFGYCTDAVLEAKKSEKLSALVKCRKTSDQAACTAAGGGVIAEERFSDCTKIGNPYCIGPKNRGKADSEGRLRLKASCLSGTELSCSQLDAYLDYDKKKEAKETDEACADQNSAACIDKIPQFHKTGQFKRIESLISNHCEVKADHKLCSLVGGKLLQSANSKYGLDFFEQRCATSKLDSYCYTAWAVYITKPHTADGEFKHIKSLCAKTSNVDIACNVCLDRLISNDAKVSKSELKPLTSRLCSLNATCSAKCKANKI